jgi:type I restriction enzyme, S subunit
MASAVAKSASRRFRFSDLAICVNDRVDNPSEAGVDRYVGLEHLDSESLRIRRWGAPTDVEATKLRFRKGDIIFGRRRAYQRKLAVADFDGICSAHAMVLRARSEVVLPEFLPFLMQSDLFMERALSISVGSLSPTINWKTLAQEEFIVPSLEEQNGFVEMLSAVEECIFSVTEAAEAASVLAEAFVQQALSSIQQKTGPVVQLGDVADVQYGFTVNASRRNVAVQRPYLTVSNVQRGVIDLTHLKETGLIGGDERFELRLGDILVVEGHADPNEIGRAAIWGCSAKGVLHQNHLIRVRCRQSEFTTYIIEVLNSSHGRAYFRSMAKSTSGLYTLNSTVVREFPLVLPDRCEQEQVVRHLRKVRQGWEALEERKQKLITLKRAGLKQIGFL